MKKVQLQKNFDDALVRLDSLSGMSNKLQGVLSDRQKILLKMKLRFAQSSINKK